MNLKFINYNWMPTVADHILDFDESFYRNIGISRLHEKKDFPACNKYPLMF